MPFSNRNQRIRFNSMEDRVSVTKRGPHIPSEDRGMVSGNLLTARKSILKHTDHEILVDKKREGSGGSSLSQVLMPETTTNFLGKTLTNEDALFCAKTTETASVIFASAERHIRGAVDILTFPCTTSIQNKVEALSRVKNFFLIITEGLRKIVEVYEVNGTERMRTLVSEMEGMRGDAKRVLGSVKDVTKFNRKVFKRWSGLLRQKGVFKTERQDLCKPPQLPLYSRTMPENVTLYEDVMDVGGTFIGSFVIHWAPGRLAFRAEEDEDVVEFESCPMEVQFELLLEVIWHVRDMLRYSEQFMIIGLGNVKTQSLADSYEAVKSRILDMEFDSCFDPFCALELRAVLADLVTRKGLLLNITEQALIHLRWIYNMTSTLTRFSHQIYKHMNGTSWKRLRRVICCLPKFVEYEDLVFDLSPAVEVCVDVPAPMTTKFQQILYVFCIHIESANFVYLLTESCKSYLQCPVSQGIGSSRRAR